MDETPVPNPGTAVPSLPASPAASQTAASGEEQALAVAKGLVDKGAPWKAGMTWPVVLTEGIVLGVAGLFIWLSPQAGARAALILMGLILLVTAALSAWRLLRDQVVPGRIAAVAFRSGVGLTVGLTVVIGSLIAQNAEVATVAIAVMLGIGLVLYGLAAFAAALLRREPGAGLPVVALVIAGLTVIVGLLLLLGGRDIESLERSFTMLGILLLVVGLGLCGYAWMLRSANRIEPAE